MRTLELRVEQADVVDHAADVLALKYAAGLHGADEAVARELASAGVGLADLNPGLGEHRLYDTRGALRALRVLFVGTPRLSSFDYAAIQRLVHDVLDAVEREAPDAAHLVMTAHGANFGLDLAAAFRSQVEALLARAGSGRLPRGLARVSFVEKGFKRAQILRQALLEALQGRPGARLDGEGAATVEVGTEVRSQATLPSGRTAFVAMPFSDEMTDVYNYGIQGPLRQAGLLCGRVDYEVFLGDVLAQIKGLIETASLVVADLSGSNPNVYLEVGYAWGRGIPTILLTRSVDDLRFDVKGQRCVVYRNITQLEELLSRELSTLRARGVI